MKKTLSLVLALVMVLGSFSTVFAADTVNAVDTASKFLNAEKVLVGNDKGDLMLKENLLRQDTVILVSKLMGAYDEAAKFPTAKGTPTYEDIRNPFYLPVLAWAQANKTFVGHTDAKFGFGENLTAQEYSKVLLTALGYKVAPNGDSDIKWADALAKAKEFKILENVKVENSTEITRGDMAVMTFNALGVTMKDSKKTLAETLNIKMPAADKLKVEVKDTENLKEIVVGLSNAKLADKEKLENANNYRLTGFVVESAELKGNDVILLLKGEDALVKGREYELVIRGIEKDVNGKYKFVAKDNTIPAVEKVEVLGEYGIKVTTTEPISEAKERNFLVDGKNVSMKIEQYGRDIILTPYYKASFNAKTLTIKELVDFAGYKSVEKDFEIAMIKDDVAPKVVDVISKGNKVEVIFDKDVQKDSVSEYDSRSAAGNISYESGRHTVYAEKADKVGTNKVLYTFKEELPRRTVVTIVDVANHSKVKMEKTTMEARLVLDNTEPQLIDNKIKTNHVNKTATITLYFDKDVEGEFLTKAKDETRFNTKKHFALYNGEVYKRNIIKEDHYEISAKYDVDKKDKVKKDVIVVEVKNLEKYDKDKENDYVLEIFDFADSTSSRNKMYKEYVDFKVKETTDFTVKNINVYKGRGREDVEVTIEFNKSADIVTAENPTNYIFQDGTSKDDVKDLKGEVVLEGNGKKVTLIMPNFDLDDYKELRILDAIKDKDGNRLDRTVTYNFKTGLTDNADYTIVKNIHGTFDVKPEKGLKEITLKTDAKETFVINNNSDDTLKKVIIDAPNAHVTVPAGVELEKVEVKAIGANSLQILGKVKELVISTKNPVKVILVNDRTVEIVSTVKEAIVNVVVGNEAAKEVKVKEGEPKLVKVDAAGNISGAEVDLTLGAQAELTKVKAAVTTTPGGITLEVEGSTTSGAAIELSKVKEALGTKVNTVVAKGYEVTVTNLQINDVTNIWTALFKVTEKSNVSNTIQEITSFNINFIEPAKN